MSRSGTFLSSFLLTSLSASAMFCDRPFRASRNIDSPFTPFAPPHMTRRSPIRVSPLAQFDAKLLESDMRKFACGVLADLFFPLEHLAVPAAGKLLDDPRSFPTVLI